VSGSPFLQTEVRVIPHLGVPELLIILVIIVLVFGVGKLPQIGKALGQGIREFRESTQGSAEEESSEASSTKSGEA
jgi:sec-independent protein translocase protein TatA